MDPENGDAAKSQKPDAFPWSYLHDLQHMPDGPRVREVLTQVFLSVPVISALLAWLIVAVLHGLPNIPWRLIGPAHKPELRPKSFYDGDGAIAYDYEVVPDVIHLVRNNEPQLEFMDVVFYRSMYLNHRPRAIVVHCHPCGFTGPFVNWTKGINFTFKPFIFPTHIFDSKIETGVRRSDMARIHILRRYGGIYLDRDVFVIQSLRRFLHYEAAVPCPPGAGLTNNIMILHKNSRFLKLFTELHRGYNESRGGYYTSELPTTVLAHKRQHLLRCMNYGLEAGLDMIGVAFEPHAFPNWRSAFAVHPYIHFRGESPYDPLSKSEYNETTIRDLDNAMGQMARSVLFGTSDFVGPDEPVLSVAELAARKDRGEDLTKVTPESTKPFYDQ